MTSNYGKIKEGQEKKEIKWEGRRWRKEVIGQQGYTYNVGKWYVYIAKPQTKQHWNLGKLVGVGVNIGGGIGPSTLYV